MKERGPRQCLGQQTSTPSDGLDTRKPKGSKRPSDQRRASETLPKKLGGQTKTSILLAAEATRIIALAGFPLLVLTAPAADVQTYLVAKFESYDQLSSNQVVPSASDQFGFEAVVTPNGLAALGAAAVIAPNGNQYALHYGNTIYADGYGSVQFVPPPGRVTSFLSPEDDIASRAALNSLYPNGSYTLRISTPNDGTRVLQLTLTGDAYPSVVPQIKNLTQAQNINAAAPFVIQWFPFLGGRTVDYVRLGIFEGNTHVQVFDSGTPGTPGALNGTSTSVTIPPLTLSPGGTYRANLIFGTVTYLDASSYPGALGQAGYGYNTSFVLKTAGIAQLPAITSQPRDQTVPQGSPVTFSLTAQGTSPLRYRWGASGFAFPTNYWPLFLEWTTNNSLTLTNVQPFFQGSYYVEVANAAGRVQSVPFSLTVGPPPIPPTITSQPRNQMVAVGQNASFAVTATGTAPLSYRWYFKDSALPGAIGAVLTINGAQPANAGAYFVKVSNAGGSVTSSTANLTIAPVNAAPVILTQPKPQETVVGASVTFTVSASGTAPLRFQWRKNGSVIPGETSSSLTIAKVSVSDAGAYSVDVVNDGGKSTSASAILTVLPVSRTGTNSVLLFDGSAGAQVVIQSADDLQSTNGITLEAWFEPVTVTPGIYSAIISKEDGINATSHRSYELRWFPDGKVYGIFFLAGSTYASVSAPLPLGQWTHIAASFNGPEGAVRLYTNGVLAATATQTDDNHQSLAGLTLRQTSLPLIFGHFAPYPNTALEGSLDEVRVWKICRTAADIAGNFACRLAGTEPGLSGYWTFDQINASDLTGHGHDGSLVGTVRVVLLPGADVIHAACNQLRVAASISSNQEVEVSFLPVLGGNYAIEASADLEHWTVLTAITNAQRTVSYREPLNLRFGRRFYRAGSDGGLR